MPDHASKDIGMSNPHRGKHKISHKKGQAKIAYSFDANIWSSGMLSPANIGLSIVILLVYFNSLDGNFVHDDLFAIQRNEDVTGQKPWYHAFQNDFWGKSMADNTSHKSYRPLTVLTFRMNYWLGGGKPYTFHVVNSILHLSVIHLLTYISWRLLRLSDKSAKLVGLMFAVHPVHSEAVAGIVGRAEILAAVLFLLSFIFYVWNVDAENEKPEYHSSQIYISFILGAASMLCKETGITVLGISIIYDSAIFYQRFSEMDKKTVTAFVRRMFKSFIMIFGLLTFRMWIMVNTLPIFKEEDNPSAFASSSITRFLTYSHLCAWNGYLMLLPITLCYDWQASTIPLVNSFLDPRNIFTVAFFLILITIIIKSLQNKTDCTIPVVMSLAFMIIPFLPASNLFFPVGFVIAERVLYIPSIGYCILIVYGLNLLERRFQPFSKQICAVFIFICFLLSLKTWQQNRTWNSRESLFLSGLRVLPQNAKVHYNFANLMRDKGQTEVAIDHYQKVLTLWPKHASSHNNLGILMTDKKQARFHYEKALEISPQHISALINLGALLHGEGNTQQAIVLIQKAVDLSAPNAQLFLMLGNLLVQNNQMEEAQKFFEAVISMKPNYADAYNHYGSFFQQKGDIKKALEFYQKAVDRDSQHIRAMSNAAHSHEHLHQYDEAEMMLLRAISIQPTPAIMDQLGMLYFNRGQFNKSLNVFQQILNVDSHAVFNNTDVILHYAQVLAESNKMAEAKAVLLQIIKSNSNYNQSPQKSAKVKATVLLSRMFGMQKLHQDAVDLLSDTIDSHHGSEEELTELFYERGNHQRDNQQFSLALQSYKKSLEFSQKKDGKTEFNIGTVYHLLGNCKEARVYYKKAAKLDPGNKHISVNLQKLNNMEKQERRKNSNNN